MIVYAGDDIRRFIPDPETNYFEQLASLSHHGLVAVTGNDDPPDNRSLIRGQKVFEVHSRPVIIGDFFIVGLEGAPSPGIGPTLHTESCIFHHLESSFLKNTKGTIIAVSHVPPRGCLDEAIRFGNRQIGSTALRKVVEAEPRLSLVVCGHAHNCGGHQDNLGYATVLNAASHDNSASVPANIATLILHSDGTLEDLQWSKVLSPFRLASEINGIGRVYAKQLAENGILEVEDLADALPETVGLSLGRSSVKSEIFIARARARLEGQPLLIAAPKLPERPRLYLDIETDVQQSFIWLVGVATEESNRVFQFWLMSPQAAERYRLGA